jgi:hypothetical protein
MRNHRELLLNRLKYKFALANPSRDSRTVALAYFPFLERRMKEAGYTLDALMHDLLNAGISIRINRFGDVMAITHPRSA